MSYQATIINELNNNYLKLDLGEKYYYGEIKSDFFPEIFQNKYLDVIMNSFNNNKNNFDNGQEITGYIDDTESYHEENKYIIKVSINQGVIQYTKYIEIPIKLIKKN